MCGASSGADSESGVVRKADRHPRHHPRRGHRACLRSGRERGIESISAVLQIRTQKCARSAGCKQLLHEEEEIRASSQQRKTRTSCYLPTINDAHLLHARHDEPDGLDGAGGRLFLIKARYGRSIRYSYPPINVRAPLDHAAAHGVAKSQPRTHARTGPDTPRAHGVGDRARDMNACEVRRAPASACACVPRD